MLDRAVRLARSARPYLPGFGTSGSLLAGAALMFVVASALVAFRGWPHLGTQPSPGKVVISPRPAAASVSSRRLAVFSGALLPTGGGGSGGGGAARGGRPGGGRPGGGGTGGGGVPSQSIGRPVSSSIPVAASGGGTGGSSSCSAGCGSAPAPNPGPGPAQPVKQVIKQTTSALGGVVSGTGQQVGTVVQQTTGAVSGAVQPVSQPVSSVVSSVGTGAAKTVTGVTQTIAGTLSGFGSH